MKHVSAKYLYYVFCHIRMHFVSETFDYVKYNGKTTKAGDKFLQNYEDSLNLRENVRKTLEKTKISTRQDAVMYAIACVLANTTTASSYTAFFHCSDEALEEFRSYKKFWSNPEYHFNADCKKLAERSEDIHYWLTAKGRTPRLLTAYMSRLVNPWSIVLLNEIYRFLPYWDKTLGKDGLNMMWINERSKLVKLPSFVKAHFNPKIRDKFAKIAKSSLLNKMSSK
jgi:hypothetical protein